jgi:hypothetical protein
MNTPELRVSADPARELEAVHAGQSDVEQYRIR